jgi:hypothetical protein
LSLSQIEQLDQLRTALLELPELRQIEISPSLQGFLGIVHRAA